MGQALYRKYRPRSFAEAIGQEAITKTLQRALKTGRISHAYLFAGPRGVGKTSFARILARSVNKLPYDLDDNHLDIIEIDAASNRRIEEVRDLREKVHMAPTSSTYKVYIIDEVHMLTREAFNALLKTLEEPPAHCIFILATTEPHKLPETIISRTQRFNFKPIDHKIVRQHLADISKKERIDIEDKALDILTYHGEGSLRDIIGMLDQLSSGKQPIKEEAVRDLLGIPPSKSIGKLIEQLQHGNTSGTLQTLQALKEHGSSPVVVAKELSQQLRQKLLEEAELGNWATKLMSKLLDVSSSSWPQDALEIAVIGAAAEVKNNRGESSQKPPVALKVKSPVKKAQKPDRSGLSSSFDLSQWNLILNRVKAEAPSLYTALRLSQPSIEDGRLQLKFPFTLHQKKVNEAKHLDLIAKHIQTINGSAMPIDCLVDKNLSDLTLAQESATPANSNLQTISNIFGAAEVLES